MLPNAYGEITILLAYMIFFNVILSYGMETAYFRFYNKQENKQEVSSTVLVAIFWSSILFLSIALLFQKTLAGFLHIEKENINYAIWILTLDALVMIPFAQLRAEEKPLRFAIIKLSNVLLNIGLNIFFLSILPNLAIKEPNGFWSSFFFEDYQVGYVFLANLIASLSTFIIFSPQYFSFDWKFNKALFSEMMRYGWPILFAGLAFGINEHLDKILLGAWLDPSLADTEVGAYSACYKIGLFMVLYRTAYTLGIEPFFFSQVQNKNAPQTYATVTKYFVIFGSLISLVVVVFADIIKIFFIPQEDYWKAMKIVPLIIYANFFLGIYTSLSVWYKLIDKTIIGAYISTIGAIITLVFNYVLITKFQMSYMGSAITTLIAYGVMMLVSYFLGRKKYPIPFELKTICTYLGVSIALSALSFYIDILRQTYVFGILAILVFCYYIYRNEKSLILRIIKRK